MPLIQRRENKAENARQENDETMQWRASFSSGLVVSQAPIRGPSDYTVYWAPGRASAV